MAWFSSRSARSRSRVRPGGRSFVLAEARFHSLAQHVRGLLNETWHPVVGRQDLENVREHPVSRAPGLTFLPQPPPVRRSQDSVPATAAEYRGAPWVKGCREFGRSRVTSCSAHRPASVARV